MRAWDDPVLCRAESLVVVELAPSRCCGTTRTGPARRLIGGMRMHSTRLRGSTMHIRRGRAPRHSAITLADRARSSIAKGPVEDAQAASDRLHWCRGPSAELPRSAPVRTAIGSPKSRPDSFGALRPRTERRHRTPTVGSVPTVRGSTSRGGWSGTADWRRYLIRRRQGMPGSPVSGTGTTLTRHRTDSSGGRRRAGRHPSRTGTTFPAPAPTADNGGDARHATPP